MLDAALLFIGLTILIFGTRLSIDRAILIAEHYRLSDMFVGVVILAVGSDLPEIVISITAAIHQLDGVETSGLILGNVLGSSFAQIGLIMGVSGLLGYLTLGRRYVYLHGGVLLGAILYLTMAALDGVITRVEAVILILAFVIYLAMLYEEERGREKPERTRAIPLVRTWLIMIAGFGMVIYGSELTVNSTISLAQSLGVSQSFIAIIVIGIGSSLPELTISVAALMKARGGLSVGNLVGSNILDTLLPVGLAGVIHPLGVESRLVNLDLPLLFLLTLLVLAFFLRKRGLQRSEAVVLLLFYGGYLVLKLSGY